MDEPMGPVSGGGDPLLGATIAGRYRIVALIARGGMGKVYKAEQSALGRICALKVVAPGEQAERDPEFFKRFSREASTAAKLSHPCSVTIFDYGRDEEKNLYFIAMEYLDGRTLHRVIHDQGAISEPQANRIAQQICRSLSEAHGLGLVHRDLKPGNVLLVRTRGEEEEHVKVLDFGLVKDLTAQGDELTQTGTFMGSPKYTPPEQVMGGEITARSDIYSLGVVIYEMLCGKPPFDKKVATATLMAHVSEKPPSLAERNPDVAVSPAMEAIVVRCMEKSPAHRFGSMREVLTALKVAAGEAVDLATGERPSLTELSSTGSGRPSAPTMTITGSGPRPVLAVTMPTESESLSPPPPQTSSTLWKPPPPRKRSFGVIGIALLAAAIGGAAALTLGNRGRAPEGGASRIESVVVPIAVPAGNAVAPNPAAGLRLFRIQSDPPGARVSDRGTEVCMATPCRIVLQGDAEYTFKLVKSGYKPAELTVKAEEENASVALEPIGGDMRAASAGQPYGTPGAAAPGETAAPTAAAPAAEAAAPAAAEPAAGVGAPAPEPAVAAPAPEPAAAAAPSPAPAPAAAAPAVMHFQDGMTRPVPISAPAPVYTREALTAKVQGTVIAKCVITTSGTLTGCRIVKGQPHMNEAVLSALAASRYRPVTYEGRPVNVDYVFSIKLVPP